VRGGDFVLRRSELSNSVPARTRQRPCFLKGAGNARCPCSLAHEGGWRAARRKGNPSGASRHAGMRIALRRTIAASSLLHRAALSSAIARNVSRLPAGVRSNPGRSPDAARGRGLRTTDAGAAPSPAERRLAKRPCKWKRLIGK
jgi:hypothetical protein